jgi:hypothetical protein
MTDREFLMDVHDRLARAEALPQTATMLHMLRGLILLTPAKQQTACVTEFNSMDELRRYLAAHP